ncbi:MAG: GHMP kinase [Gemmatimonadetes bacterium]|nr:GHMP kinase [Gemmatimonadota bacterium]
MKDKLIRAKAPLRVSFAGGGTDVSPFVEREGGCVVSATINRYAHGTLRIRPGPQVTIQSLDFGATVEYDPHELTQYDGHFDLAKAAINRMCPGEAAGLELFLHSDVPPGSGLGSSSTLVVTLVALLKEYRRLSLSKYQIADLAYQIERVDLGIRGGYQDQYAAAFGGFNFIEFSSAGVAVRPLGLPPATINELETNLLLAYTGAPRLSSHIIEDQVARYESGEGASVQGLRELKALAVEMREALVAGQLSGFGELLHREWETKQRLSPKIGTTQLAELYGAARAAGASGGKAVGAGGGGFMLLYCPFDRKHQIAETLRKVGCTVSDLAFSAEGVQTWTVPGD